MKKLDKKQLPQFAALCILSAGVFGYFVLRLVTPSPAAAGNRPVAVTARPALAAPVAPDKKAAPVVAAAPDTGEDAAAPAPTLGMRDPFMADTIAAKAVPPGTASLAPAKPALPALPKPGRLTASIREISPAPVTPAFSLGLKGFPAAPAAPGFPAAPALPTAPVSIAPPSWSVTGVLQGASEKVAILRSGSARRIVHSGDFVDSVYRVIEVTRTSVVLRHGPALYRLTLGGLKTAPAATPLNPMPMKPVLPTALPFEAVPPGAAPASFLPAGAALKQETAPKPEAKPTDQPQETAYQARTLRSGLRLASYSVRQSVSEAPTMRRQEKTVSAQDAHTARARLKQGSDLYQIGLHTEGRALWSLVLTMSDPAAAATAVNLLHRHP